MAVAGTCTHYSNYSFMLCESHLTFQRLRQCKVAGKYYTLSGKIAGCELILSGIHIHDCMYFNATILSEQYTQLLS